MSKPTRKTTPDKPHPDFPLFPHATGYWAKKVRQKLHYFGKVKDDPKGEKALDKWLEQKDDLLAGRTPRVHPDGLIIMDLLNKFLTAKRHLLDSGELSPRTFAEHYATCTIIGDAFGMRRRVADLASDDFDRLRKSMAKAWGPVRLGNEIQRVRSVFKFAYDATLIDKPVRFGPQFKKPSRKVMRLNRAKKGLRMFEADALRTLITAAGLPMRAMILLGINCGFGNSDVANLPASAVDLKIAWVDFPRPKTGIPRRCPLWPETVAAIREALDKRPKAKNPADAKLLFVTKYGGKWATANVGDTDPDTGETKISVDDPVSKEFAKLIRGKKLHRPGLGFYALRHGFETVAGDAKDQVAVDSIMGHAGDDMASLYRERISDERLKAVTDHVHKWLFGEASETNASIQIGVPPADG